MKKFYLLIAVLAFSTAVLAQTDKPQKPIFYSISFPNVVHHEAEIFLILPQAPAGPIRFRMSRSSAGRYATHEFGKNIYNVQASNIDGSALSIKQLEGDLYEVEEHGDAVKISYTLYGNWTDGTYTSIDPSHAHLNPFGGLW